MKFPNEWMSVRLGEVVTDIQPGFAQAPGDDDTGIGQIRTHNVTPEGTISLDELKYVSPSAQELEKYTLQKGDVVFNNTNSEEWVGKTAYYDLSEPLVFSNHMTRIRVNQELIDAEFLARYLHFLWKIGLSKTRAKRWVSQAGIDQRELVTFKLPLPPLPEQKRIVEILKQADALRRQRRKILDQAKQLPTALFLEMFGDPRKAKSSWKRKPLQKLVEVRSSLETPNPDTHADALCIGPDSIESATGMLISTPTVQEVQPKSGKYWFEPNDVLFSKIRPNLRKATLAETQGFCSADMYALICGDEIRPMFLLYLLLSDAFTQFALSRSGRAQQPKLNREQLLSYKVVVPPMDLQKKFEESIRELKKIVDEMEANTGESDLLQKSLEITAFTGELTESWRETRREELEAWLREHAEQLGKRPARVKIEAITPPERKPPARPTRRWLIEQLSEIQAQVYLALQEWKDTLIPSADLDEFLNQRPVEHLEDAHDQLRRALEQLAGLGLIAKVSLPTDSGDYVTGYRVLREEELSKPDDLERLGA